MTKRGVLLVNLGSPDAPTPQAVRKYLFEFLHDKRVIDTSRWIWCPILHGIILRVRPKKSAALYAKIWNQLGGGEGQEAPLVRVTREQTAGVQAELGNKAHVETAMRYGAPSVKSAMDKLQEKGCEQITILPLYPQFSHTTTSSVQDAVDKAVATMTSPPQTETIQEYHENASYIKAIGDSLKAHLVTLSWEPDVILASFHGLPQRYVDQGDPYASQCKQTTDLVREYLGVSDDKFRLTFQSRFGPMAWLQPYTSVTLEELGKSGVKNVAVITPGFAADCLETLEEIAIEGRETFMEAGGENFSIVPCLNNSPEHIEVLTKLVNPAA